MSNIAASGSRRLAVALATLLCPLAFAAPPSTSPYATDPQSSHVADQTSDGIRQVNMIACYMASMRPDALVNKGPYIALVDQNVCDSSSSSSSSATGAAASQAPSYQQAIVDSSRTSMTTPMRAKVWLDQTNGDGSGKERISINVSASLAPSTTNPYGVFRLDFCGAPPTGGACVEQGLLSAKASGVSFFQTSTRQNGGGSTALTLSASGTSGGSGEMRLTQGTNQVQYMFAYDATLFRRSDGTNDECFSRDATDPGTGFSVFQYGLYDAITGAQIQRNSGFPLDFTVAGTTYHAYMSYWGMSVSPDAARLLTNGATVQKVSYNGNSSSTTSYTLALAAGKLTKYTKRSTTLHALDKIHFNIGIGDATNFFPMAVSNTQYELYWDDASGKFVVTAQVNCGNNGCNPVDLPAPQSVDVGFWANQGGINGWSQSFGGQLFINLQGVTAPVTSANVSVVYRLQDLVYPSDLPQTLFCIRDCPTAASLTSFFAAGSPDMSPFGATSNNWNPTPANAVVTYTTSSSSALLLDAAGYAVTFTDATAASSRPQFQNGVSSGRLFTTLSDAQCAVGQYCDNNVGNLDVYYVWQTGVGSWNQFAAVKDAMGVFVKFDAPLQVNYTVPSGAAYGAYAGTTLVLQYGGFGQLWGIPGNCFSPITNAPISCDTPNSRYVAAFMIPMDTVTGAVVDGQTTYLVRWLDREIRFAKKDPAVCAAAGLLLPSGGTLPDATGLQNPTDASSPIYIGTEPTVTTEPRVIQGVVKY